MTSTILAAYCYHGRHRPPSTTGRTVARLTVVAMAAALPLAGTVATASADDPLDEIAECESGGDIRAQNPRSTASGKYQFLDSTWRSLGGTGSASDHSEAVQDRMARRLLAEQGTTPWNASRSCWSGRASGQRGSGQRSASAGAERPRERQAAAESRPRARERQRPAQGSSGRSYVVRRGDTLGSIAAAHGTSWRALYRLNRGVVENPNLIYPGERLALR